MNHYACHRHGSRLIWFVIGAGVATFWLKSKEAHEWKARHCLRDRIPQQAYPAPGTPPAPPTTPAPSGSLQEHREHFWGPRGEGGRPGWGSGPWTATTNPPPPPPPPHVPPTPMPTDRWEEERQLMQSLGKQATETISEFSEATLEKLLSTAENLKSKLAEQRALREQHEQQMKTLRDEQLKQFEEWQKQQEQEKPAPPRHVV
ncbi:hypothetical protein A0H81_06026 [Grifola frondosa]|uniref:Uncharacterized protein n=1 Tax=Grifola frondosa TaxID=5627 RepID=A0A1C7MAF1_GRIFR|nr:hypothetical protein A0H81_06026 [Grifola frondosa]